MVGFYFSFHNGTLLMDIGNVLKEIYVNGEGGDTVVCEGFCGCKWWAILFSGQILLVDILEESYSNTHIVPLSG